MTHNWCLDDWFTSVSLTNIWPTIKTLFINLTLLCHICWKVCSPTVTYDWLCCVNRANRYFVWIEWIVTCATSGEGNALSGTPDFTHSLYIHYIICQSTDYVYALMNLVYLPGLVLPSLSRTYFILLRNPCILPGRHIWDALILVCGLVVIPGTPWSLYTAWSSYLRRLDPCMQPGRHTWDALILVYGLVGILPNPSICHVMYYIIYPCWSTRSQCGSTRLIHKKPMW